MLRGRLALLLMSGVLLSGLPGAVAAQSNPRQILPNIPLQADNGKPDPAAGVVRRVDLVQLDAEGEPTERKLALTCPAAGCQGALELLVEGRTERFSVTVTFVARGTYVNLEPRTLGTSRIVEFGTGRTSPAFIATREREIATRDVHYVISRDATTRRAVREGPDKPDPKTLADGFVFTRKLESDVTLRAEIRVVPK
jgi:hypothetical protein